MDKHEHYNYFNSQHTILSEVFLHGVSVMDAAQSLYLCQTCLCPIINSVSFEPVVLSVPSVENKPHDLSYLKFTRFFFLPVCINILEYKAKSFTSFSSSLGEKNQMTAI